MYSSIRHLCLRGSKGRLVSGASGPFRRNYFSFNPKFKGPAYVRGVRYATAGSEDSDVTSPPPPPGVSILDWHSVNSSESADGVEEGLRDSTFNAFFVARRIDVVRLFQKEYGSEAHSLHRDSVIVAIEKEKNYGSPGYAVFFEYGAVVFFCLDNTTRMDCLQAARPFCSSLVQLPRSEELSFEENQSLTTSHTYDRDKIVLKNLEPETIRVVAGVLGQSVALDHYEREVDSLLGMFRSLNASIQSTGRLAVKRRELYRLVATNNTILTDVITKLKVMDRARPGESAWNIPEHYAIWERLREEFEIRTRFENMEFKLDLIRENMKFFVEVLATKKGTRLEIAIIVLIWLELMVALYEHVDWNVLENLF